METASTGIQTDKPNFRVDVQTASTDLQADKPDFTEWAARPPSRLDDEADEGDAILWGEQEAPLDKL